jgi:hypothetical protein
MRNLAIFILTFFVVFFAFQPAQAQKSGSFPASNLGLSYDFGKYITFQATLTLPSAPSEAYLVFQAEGEQNTHIIPIQLDTQGKTSLRYEISQGAVRPFAIVRFHYRVKLQNGEELNSEEFFFKYEDNRFPWQVANANLLTVHWYGGDTAFGQDALDVAKRGMKQAQELLLVNPSKPIDIYIYASGTDLTNALEIGAISWVGGHTSPDLRLILVSIPSGPEQGLEMDRKIAHELAHILTYDLMGERYTHLPIWIREGIATHNELSPNPDYPRALTQASTQKTLIAMKDLCGSFPPESGRAFLAYAESESFSRFIIDKYGQTGLLALTSAYGDGLDCEQGMRRALGQPLSQVELDWHASSLGENAGLTAFNNMFPSLAILGMVLAVSLISAFTFNRNENAG